MEALSIRHHIDHKYARGHNNRTKVANAIHIDKNGVHFEWMDKSIQDAYTEVFSDSVERWNEKQIKSNNYTRVYDGVDDYIQKLKQGGKHIIWEAIVSYGNIDDRENLPDEKVARAALKEYAEDFIERNKEHIKVTGVYYHADELGVPHLHLDYFFYATEQSRGMDKQVSQDKALKQLFKEQDIKIQKSDNRKCSNEFYTFQQVERDRQVEIGRRYGIESQWEKHKKTERRAQLDTRAYEAYRDDQRQQAFDKRERKIKKYNKKIKEYEMTRQELEEEIKPLRETQQELIEQNKKLQLSIDGMSAILTEVIKVNMSNPLMRNEMEIAKTHIMQMDEAKDEEKVITKTKGRGR